jgi:hypothetical protein
MSGQQSGRATAATLQDLWRALLRHLIERLENPPAEGLRASFLMVCARFLADNGVSQPEDDEGEEPGTSKTNRIIQSLKRLETSSPQ